MKFSLFRKSWMIIAMSLLLVSIVSSASLAIEPQVLADGKAQDTLFIINDAQSFKNVQLKGESSAEKVNILITSTDASLTLSGNLTMESYAIGNINLGGKLKANEITINRDSTLTVANFSQVEAKNVNISDSMFFLSSGSRIDIANTLELSNYTYFWVVDDETTFTAKTMEITTSAIRMADGSSATSSTVKANSGTTIYISGRDRNEDPSRMEIGTVTLDISYLYAEKGASIKIGTGTLNNKSKLIATVDAGSKVSSNIEINNLNLNGLSYLCAVNNATINVTSNLKANNDGVIYAIYPESKIYIKSLSLSNISELSARIGGYASVDTVTVASKSYIISRDVDVDSQISSLIEIVSLTADGTRIHAYEGGQIKIGNANVKNEGYLLAQGIGPEVPAAASIEVETVSLSEAAMLAQSGGTIKAGTVNAKSKSTIQAYDLGSFIKINRVILSEAQIVATMGGSIVVSGEIEGKNNSNVYAYGAEEGNYEFSAFIKAENINLSKSTMYAEDGGLILGGNITLSSSSTLEISSALALIATTGLSEKKVILNFDVNSGAAGLARLVYGAAQHLEHLNEKIENYSEVSALVGDVLVSRVFADSLALNSSTVTIKAGGALISNNIIADKNSEIMCEEGAIIAESIELSSKTKFTVLGINSLTHVASTVKAKSMKASNNSWLYILGGSYLVISEDMILSASELTLRQGSTLAATNVILKDKASFVLAGICSSNVEIDSKSTLSATGSLVGDISNQGTFKGENFEMTGKFKALKGAVLNLTLLKENLLALAIEGSASFEGNTITIEVEKGFTPVNGQEYLIVSTTSGIEGNIASVKQSKSISGYSFAWGMTADNLGIWVKWYK